MSPRPPRQRVRSSPLSEEASIRARLRKTVSALRMVLWVVLLLVAATAVFLFKLRDGTGWDTGLGILVHVQLVICGLLLGFHAWSLQLATRQPRSASLLSAIFETLALVALLPLLPLALVFPALLFVTGMRVVANVSLWILVAKSSEAARILDEHPEIDPTLRVAARETSRAHAAADRRAERARTKGRKTALRVAGFAAPLALLVAGGLWLASPARAFDGAAADFVERWNTDVGSVEALFASAETREEWDATIENLEWRRSRPFLEAEWTTQTVEDDYIRTLHRGIHGEEVESWWRHDGEWKLIGVCVPLEGVVERFRDVWNGHDVAALPWFFARPGRAAQLLEHLVDTRDWGATMPSLGMARELDPERGKRVFDLPLEGGRVETSWRFTGGRWRITDFKPPSP